MVKFLRVNFIWNIQGECVAICVQTSRQGGVVFLEVFDIRFVYKSLMCCSLGCYEPLSDGWSDAFRKHFRASRLRFRGEAS